MSETLGELRRMPDETLIERHDRLAEQTQVGVNHYRAEYVRRAQDRQTQTMLRYSWWITLMTGVMTVATILNVVVACRAG